MGRTVGVWMCSVVVWPNGLTPARTMMSHGKVCMACRFLSSAGPPHALLKEHHVANSRLEFKQMSLVALPAAPLFHITYMGAFVAASASQQSRLLCIPTPWNKPRPLRTLRLPVQQQLFCNFPLGLCPFLLAVRGVPDVPVHRGVAEAHGQRGAPRPPQATRGGCTRGAV